MPQAFCLFSFRVTQRVSLPRQKAMLLDSDVRCGASVSTIWALRLLPSSAAKTLSHLDNRPSRRSVRDGKNQFDRSRCVSARTGWKRFWLDRKREGIICSARCLRGSRRELYRYRRRLLGVGTRKFRRRIGDDPWKMARAKKTARPVDHRHKGRHAPATERTLCENDSSRSGELPETPRN